MTTKIKTITFNEKKEDKLYKLSDLSITDLTKLIFNFSEISERKRLQAIEHFYIHYQENVLSLIKDLSLQYLVSRTYTVESFLTKICLQTILAPIFKIECAKTLTCNPKHFSILNTVLRNFLKQPSYSIDIHFIDAVFFLSKSTSYNEQVLQYIGKIINCSNLTHEYIYKMILSIETKIKHKKFKQKAQYKAVKFFFNKETTPTPFKILSAQLLFNSKLVSSSQKTKTFQTLYKISDDENLEIDMRMDSIDIILQYGEEKDKQYAQKKILEFGYGNMIQSSIYSHAQNVHHKSIDKSVLSILEGLKKHNIRVTQRPTLQYILQFITGVIRYLPTPQKQKIHVSLNRIVMDRCLYGSLNMNLRNILIEIWIYIHGHKYKKELLNRLLEELTEMAGKCSSGYAARLVNTLSGFGDFSIRISFEDQISANVMARFNRYLMEMKDEKTRDLVLSEMTEANLEDKPNFLQFFRKSIPIIREDLYEKFKRDMTSTDFDLYMKKAIMKYEGY